MLLLFIWKLYTFLISTQLSLEYVNTFLFFMISSQHIKVLIRSNQIRIFLYSIILNLCCLLVFTIPLSLLFIEYAFALVRPSTIIFFKVVIINRSEVCKDFWTIFKSWLDSCEYTTFKALSFLCLAINFLRIKVINYSVDWRDHPDFLKM